MTTDYDNMKVQAVERQAAPAHEAVTKYAKYIGEIAFVSDIHINAWCH